MQQRFSIPIFIALLIGAAWSLYSLTFLSQGIFWDLGIYEKAAQIFNSGGNAYDTSLYISRYSGIGHLFIYQPLVLRGMAFFGSQLGTFLIFSYVASIAFFFLSLGSKRDLWLATFFAFAYCGLGTVAIGSGNVTAFLHLTLIAFLVRNINTKRAQFAPFIIAVILFSLIKPYLIGYLLIPLFATFGVSPKKRVWLHSLVAGALFIAISIGSAIYFGEEFQAFMSAVKIQTIDKHDLGHGIVMYFYEYYRSAGSLIYRAYVLHFAILSAIIFITLILVKNARQLSNPKFALLLYFLITILNPRLKVYDLFPALLALFIFSFSFPQSIPRKFLFLFAYAISLSQMADTALFVHTGILSDPLNVYYLTMGPIFISALITLLKSPKQS